MIYRMLAAVRAATRDRRGLETLEYAVFAASFLFVIAAAVSSLSGNVKAAYTDVGVFVLNQGAKM